ncbi:MAG: hypothetical protein NTW93_05400 [Phycisphaerae bacterium]|nr:hypothetical protein [Phycisphaerae bacterium]
MTKNKKIICWIIIIIAAVVVWYLYNWGGNLLKPLAIKQIKEMTGARVDIDNVRFRLSGRISFENISIGPLVKRRPDNAILTAKNLDAYFSPLSLLKLAPQLKRLRIRDFVVNLQYNNDTKEWNILALKLPTGKKKAPLPELRFKGGEIKFAQITNGQEIKTVDCRIKNGNMKKGPGSLTIAEDDATETRGNRILIKWTTGEKTQIQVDGYLPLLDFRLFGSKCNFNRFNSRITADKENIIFESVHFAIGPQTIIDVNGILQNLKEDPSFVFAVKTKDLTVRYEPADNCFAHGSRIFDKFIPMLQTFFDFFNPQGLLDLDVVLTGKVKQIAKTQCRGYLGCKDISIQYIEFPYLVEHLAGKIDVTEKSMTMKDVKASHGKVDITMNGYCGGFAETMDSHVVLSSKNMILDNDLYTALLEYHKKLWYIFSPAGTVAGDFIFTAKPPDIRKMELYGDLLDVSIMCQYFPYPVKNITGKIAVNGELIELNDISSVRDGGTIKMQGRITKANTLSPEYNFQIQANDVAVNSELISAFPQEQKKFFNNFDIQQIKGNADVYIHSVDNNEMPIDYLAKLKIHGESIKHPLLPYPLKNIALDANLTPTTLEIEKFKADFNEAKIDAAGTIWISTAKEPMGYCMRLKTLNLNLDSNLVQTVLGQTSAKLLEDYQFKGPVNLEAAVAKNARIKCPAFEIAVDCLSDSAVINKLNLPLKDITGRVIVRPENIEFAALSATPDDNIVDTNQPRITLDGKINMAEQDIDAAQLQLHAVDMRFDERLETVLGKMGKYCRKMSLAGRFDLNFDKINFYKEEPNDKILALGGTILFKNCSIGENKPISNIYALLDIDTQYKIGKGLQDCQLFLDVQNVSVKGRAFENLKVPIIVDTNEQKIIVEHFIGDFLGGKITGAAAFETDSEGKLTKYTIDTALSGVNTENFVSPQTRGGPETGGSINGELNLQGNFQQPQATRGRLTGEATGIKLWDKGIVVRIRNAILEAIQRDFAFDNVKIQAVIKGKTVYITLFDLYGPTASLRGTGTYEPASDSININFVGYGAAGKEKPNFFDSLTAGLGAAFLKVQVTGKLENPQINVEPLPIIQESLGIIGTK